REYPQHCSLRCLGATRAFPPLRFHHRRSARWAPDYRGSVRGVNSFGASACLRANNRVAPAQTAGVTVSKTSVCETATAYRVRSRGPAEPGLKSRLEISGSDLCSTDGL